MSRFLRIIAAWLDYHAAIRSAKRREPIGSTEPFDETGLSMSVVNHSTALQMAYYDIGHFFDRCPSDRDRRRYASLMRHLGVTPERAEAMARKF